MAYVVAPLPRSSSVLNAVRVFPKRSHRAAPGNLRAFKALEIMKSCHDFDSTGCHTLQMTDLPPCDIDMLLFSLLTEVLIDRALKTMVPSQHYYMALADHVHDAGRVIDIMDNKAEGLRKEIEDLKVEHEEVTHRRESLELELNDSHLFLADSQEQLEDVRAQGQVMEDELLNLTCSMEGLKVKLPQKAIVEYKESPNSQIGLVRTG
ncbi:hypothetical protein BHE74_00039089 [Ensete ventricosum]|nr:hypothetical protein BHE74_00039089 [Ensete ventricosum]